MSRPVPIWPRGPRRTRSGAAPILLGCPRVSPEWELAALRALVKPQTKSAILHRGGLQAWPADGAERVESVRFLLIQRLGDAPELHFPAIGDFFFAAKIETDHAQARAMALLLSRALPGVWLILGKHYVRDGAFFKRHRRFGWKLIRSTGATLPRTLRAALRDIL